MDLEKGPDHSGFEPIRHNHVEIVLSDGTVLDSGCLPVADASMKVREEIGGVKLTLTGKNPYKPASGKRSSVGSTRKYGEGWEKMFGKN